jgi:hypothetical protein
MIEKNLEEFYNMIISVIFGILCIYVIDMLFEKPRIINIYTSKQDE